MKIEWIALDLDGTLLGPDGKIPPKTAEHIRGLRGEYRLILISGRQFPQMLETAEALGLGGEDLMISCDGMYISRPDGELLHGFPGLREEDFLKIREEIKAGGALCCITDKGPCTVDTSLSGYIRHKLLRSLRGGRGQLAYKQLPSGLGEIEKITVKTDALEIERLKGEYSVHLNSGSWEILKLGTGKFQALSWLAREGKTDLERLLYFGDSYNDLDCMRRLKYSVAMGNAPRQVKEAAAYVTGSNREEGVYIFLLRELERMQHGEDRA